MTTDELVAGLREYVEAVGGLNEIAYVPTDGLADKHKQIRSRYVVTDYWIETHASAIADEMERLRAEVVRLSTPDILWDEDDGESAIDSCELADCFHQMGDGDERTFDCAKRLPKRVYRRVDKAGGYDIVLVPDAKGGA